MSKSNIYSEVSGGVCWEIVPGHLLQSSVPAGVALEGDPALRAVHDGGVLLAVLAQDVALGALGR